jgi:uncharacterized repeat protein (TIGR03803 family)
VRYLVAAALATTLGLTGIAAATTPTETVLYSFKGGRSGSEPWAPLISDGSGGFYGTTSGNGAKSKACGSAFQLNPPSGKNKPWRLQQLHAFVLETGDGCTPSGGLIADPSGVLYGTTSSGGANNGGTVFALTPPAAGGKDWLETILYSFTDYATPNGSLIRDANGVLYGATGRGGATDNGAVFALAPPGKGQTNWTETTLYSFQGGANDVDLIPTGPLVKDASGALYGTTYYGGGTSCQNGQGCGTVFKVTPPAAGQTTWTETLLWSFSGGADGGNPDAGLDLDKTGALYGTTTFGNPGYVVFKLSPPAAGQTAWTLSTLHTFEGSPDGTAPYGRLIFDAQGNLYDTTVGGGNGFGTVFKLTPPANGQTSWTETILYGFMGGSDGRYPYSGLVRDAAKNLFGTTSEGGAHGWGTVFEVTP